MIAVPRGNVQTTHTPLAIPIVGFAPNPQIGIREELNYISESSNTSYCMPLGFHITKHKESEREDDESEAAREAVWLLFI